jgi:DNA processing protein
VSFPPKILALREPGYPRRLLKLEKPPETIAVAGELTSERTFAIVGTRKPAADAVAFTRQLAQCIVRHGGIVVSGGAVGIDTAAHEATLDAGGKTWAVAATGHRQVFPAENAALFERIVTGGGAMIWPFPPNKKADPLSFFSRNGVLVALSDVVVVVQAAIPSGALNAAAWGRKLGRPIWAVCSPRPLTSLGAWLRAVGLTRAGKSVRTRSAPTSMTPPPLPPRNTTPHERALLDVLSMTAQHIDEIAAKSGLCMSALATALLTLALEDVVVEGPDGFFRRTMG